MSPITGRLLRMPAPPPGATPAQRAVWFELYGDRQAAHDAVECRVHAFPHRVEGDPGNAAYRYRRAGAPVCRAPLAEERDALAEQLFG